MACVFFLLFALLNTVVAFSPPAPDPSCIPMTDENKAKLNSMTDEIVEFLAGLSARYQEFDITSVKLKIDRHYDNDEDEKDTELDFTVNDCGTASVNDDTDRYSVTDDTTPCGMRPVEDNRLTVVNMPRWRYESPKVITLDLPKNAKELFCYLRHKRGPRPFLMYINGLKQFILP